MNVLAIVLISVAMNHMGLIKAIEERINVELPILDCVKCSTFWLTLIYLIYITKGVISSVAISFICSYISVWLELGMGYMDKLYLKCYEKIVSTAGSDKAPADPSDGSSADALP